MYWAGGITLCKEYIRKEQVKIMMKIGKKQEGDEEIR
jgi:hypothetical protein